VLEISNAELELLDEAFRNPSRPPDALPAGLVDAAVREYRHLRIGLQESTSLVAWACRNLLELNIYTQYVLSSEANARRFSGEQVEDGIEIFDAFQTWAARNDPALVTPEITAVLTSLVERKSKQEAAAPQRPLSIRYLSAETGLADEYANMTRVCAKLIHPSVFPILAGADEGDLPLLRPVLFRAGAGHGLEIIQAIGSAGLQACDR
jgi:hypothetical protein